MGRIKDERSKPGGLRPVIQAYWVPRLCSSGFLGGNCEKAAAAGAVSTGHHQVTLHPTVSTGRAVALEAPCVTENADSHKPP